MNMTMPDQKKSNGLTKFLGKVFEAKKEGDGDQKKLVFAGIKNNSVRPGLVAPARPQNNYSRRNPQEYEEYMKR